MAPRSLLHWGPLIALFIICFVGAMTCRLSVVLMPPTALRGAAALSGFIACVAGILTCFFLAVYTGAGTVPRGWVTASDDSRLLQFCKTCDEFKAPRSHHCRECGGCMRKLDHHCPWINACVGHANQHYFLGFVGLVPLGCSYAAGLHAWYFYTQFYARHRRSIDPIDLLPVVFSFGLAVGVAVAVGMLLALQLRGIVKNQTQIEEWIVTKSRQIPRTVAFTFPYDLGWRNNVREFVRSTRGGDGVRWMVAPGWWQDLAQFSALNVQQVTTNSP